jgi:hypothetical protein
MTVARLPAPRWQTPLPPSVVGSWGPAVAAFAEAVLGIRLDRWQRRALNRALAVDARGELVHRIYLVSTARQNGKTALVRALIGWALTARDSPPWRSILGLAHDRGQASIPYRAVLADLEPLARKYGPIGRGGLALTRYLGIRSAMYGRHREYLTASREARNAIRGMTTDLDIFDEVRTQVDYDTWAAVEPTTTASLQPLILPISTAGSDRSVLLRDWWERGIRIIDGAEAFAGFGMTWYAASDELAPDDPRAWRQASPALAEGRLTERTIRESMLTLSPATFRSERLNLWTEGSDEWLPAGTWARRIGVQPTAGIRIVLGAEAVPSWRRATVTVAIATDSGAWVGVAGELDASRTSASSVAPEALVDLVTQLVAAWHPAAIAYSGSAAAAPYLEGVAARARIPAIALGPRQIRAASQLFRSELVGGRLAHGDDPLLAQQVRVVHPSAALEGGDWYLSIRDSLGEVDGIRAAAWASWAAIAPPDLEVVPQLFL